MTSPIAPERILLVLLLLPMPFGRADAQEVKSLPDIKSPAELYQTIAALDNRLFEAYNHCDLPKFGSMLADDLEFYHDVVGFSRGRQATVEGVKNNICGKVTRELVPGTLEVYPIAHYGAVEIGVHRFYHPGQEKPVGEAKFIHLWEYKDGAWKVTRVISFDHHPLTK